jgi:hypothetical protein
MLGLVFEQGYGFCDDLGFVMGGRVGRVRLRIHLALRSHMSSDMVSCEREEFPSGAATHPSPGPMSLDNVKGFPCQPIAQPSPTTLDGSQDTVRLAHVVSTTTAIPVVIEQRFR